MEVPAQQIATPDIATSVIALDEENLLLLGHKFMNKFSLSYGNEISSNTTEQLAGSSVFLPDTKQVFVSSNKGLLIYASENHDAVTTYFPGSQIGIIYLLAKAKMVLFSVEKKLLMLDAKAFRISTVVESTDEMLSAAVSDPENEFFYTSDNGKFLSKWSVEDMKVVGRVELGKVATALACSTNGEVLFVGLEDGSFAEVLAKDLSVIRSEKLHDGAITSIHVPFRGAILTTSKDGSMKFPRSGVLPMKVSTEPIVSAIIFNKSFVACVCGIEGVKIFALPNFPKPKPFGGSDEADEVMFRLKDFVDDIREKAGPRLPLYLDLLQNTFFQLSQTHGLKFFHGTMSDCKPVGPYQTFINSSNQIRIANGSEEGKLRILTNDYSLERVPSTTFPGHYDAMLQNFNKKIEYEGLVPTSCKNPVKELSVAVLKRGDFIWNLHEQVVLGELEPKELEGMASMKFRNGTLTCFIKDGLIDISGKHKVELLVDGQTIEIINMLPDLTLIDLQKRYWILNFFSGMILEKV